MLVAYLVAVTKTAGGRGGHHGGRSLGGCQHICSPGGEGEEAGAHWLVTPPRSTVHGWRWLSPQLTCPAASLVSLEACLLGDSRPCQAGNEYWARFFTLTLLCLVWGTEDLFRLSYKGIGLLLLLVLIALFLCLPFPPITEPVSQPGYSF